MGILLAADLLVAIVRSVGRNTLRVLSTVALPGVSAGQSVGRTTISLPLLAPKGRPGTCQYVGSVAALTGVGLFAAQRTIVRLTAGERIRLALRERCTNVQNRHRSDQTLRSKCNFIHKLHLVPCPMERIPKQQIANLTRPRPTHTERCSQICTQSTETLQTFQAVKRRRTLSIVSRRHLRQHSTDGRKDVYADRGSTDLSFRSASSSRETAKPAGSPQEIRQYGIFALRERRSTSESALPTKIMGFPELMQA